MTRITLHIALIVLAIVFAVISMIPARPGTTQPRFTVNWWGLSWVTFLLSCLPP